MWAVYTLSDDTGVRYVGVTKRPDKRLGYHLREAKAGKTHRHRWIKSLSEPPVLAVIEWSHDWDEAERRWVAHYRAAGCKLVNGNDGGKTMHQLRKGPTYPAVKKVWRNIEGAHRSLKRFGTPEQAAGAAEALAKFGDAVKKLRAQGRLHIAEAHFAARYARP